MAEPGTDGAAVVLAWAALRQHGLPSAANPGITSGGLVGEGKLEYFAAMGPLARAATADYLGVANEAGLDAKRSSRACKKPA
jgi:hypothetical protein